MDRIGFVAVEDASGVHMVCYEHGDVTSVLSGVLSLPGEQIRDALEHGKRPSGAKEIAAFRLAATVLAAAAAKGRAAVVAIREENGSLRLFPESMSALCRKAFGVPEAEPVLS